MTKHNITAAAMALIGSKSRDEITKAFGEQKSIVEKVTNERDAITDTAARIAKNVEVEKAIEEAVVLHVALDLLDVQDTTEEKLFDKAVKTLGAVGIKVKPLVGSMSLTDAREANKSYLSRLF